MPRGGRAQRGAGRGGAWPGSGASSRATMAETDPKSVQDLTAVVRGRGPGGAGTGGGGLAEGGDEGKLPFWMGFGAAWSAEGVAAGGRGWKGMVPSSQSVP